MDDLLSEFIAETLETLDALSGEVVAWESDPTDTERLNAFFRFFHTVKGSCGFLNLPRFERLSHAAEEVLAAIRNGERVADPATITVVLAIMDRIGMLARMMGEGDLTTPEADDDALLDALAAEAEAVEIFVPVARPAARASLADPAPALDLDGSPVEAAPSRASSRDRAPRTIRLPLSLIDQLMNGVSDMVLSRNELARTMRDHGVAHDIESSFERLSANVAEMRDMISKTRMQRVDRLYAAIPRLVRDLCRDLDKKVSVEMAGGDVEMDREMIELVVDPLTHIVRNALDHGIECGAERRAAGKSETGSLSIVARQSGNQIVIEVSDDGRGIDSAALVEKAVARGIVSASAAMALDEQARLQLIFHAGLSTAKTVTAISGRGVGMDVVRANVEQIGGMIGIESRPGAGTKITMRVPLTLTIIPGLILRCGTRCFAIPRGNIVELLHLDSAMVAIEAIGGAQIVSIRGVRHPLVDLEDVLGIEKAESLRFPRTLLVVRSLGGVPYALGVDAVESNEELVIRPASPLVTAAGIYAGMTLPDNGQPMLLLDAAGIAEAARLPAVAEARQETATAGDSKADADSVEALHFIEFDGTERLMPLSVIDRVEDISREAVQSAAGRHFITIDGALVPVVNAEGMSGDVIKALRLRAGEQLVSYLVADVVDILTVPEPQADLDKANGEGGNIVLCGERPLEMVDPFALFARMEQLKSSPERSPRRCIIPADGDGWMVDILAPLLRQAGHEVIMAKTGDSTIDADILVVGASEPELRASEGVPVLRIRDIERADPSVPASIYRYDRAGLLDAIERLCGERAA